MAAEYPNLGVNEPEKQPSLVDRALAKRNEWAAQQPSLGGQMDALFREGLKDLQNAVLHAFPDSQRGVEEPGTPLNPTPQQVTQEQGNVHGSWQEHLNQAAQRGGNDQERGRGR